MRNGFSANTIFIFFFLLHTTIYYYTGRQELLEIILWILLQGSIFFFLVFFFTSENHSVWMSRLSSMFYDLCILPKTRTANPVVDSKVFRSSAGKIHAEQCAAGASIKTIGTPIAEWLPISMKP